MTVRVLVTGASGMIGTNVCDALLARGDEVVGLSRDPERARATNPTVTWHRWDPVGADPPPAALEGVDAVANLIGENINQRLTPEAKERIRASRVDATRNLVAAMRSAATTPPVLVSQCAVGRYGNRGAEELDESAPAASDWTGRMCAEWEAAALEAEEAGARVAVLRSAPVLDPAGGLLKQILLPFKLGVGGALAGGEQYMPWIHRDDMCAVVLWALDNAEASGPLNVTAPGPITNREFTKALGRVLRRPTIAPVPRAALVAMRGAELADQVLASMRVLPRRLEELGYRFKHPEIEAALRDLLR